MVHERGLPASATSGVNWCCSTTSPPEPTMLAGPGFDTATVTTRPSRIGAADAVLVTAAAPTKPNRRPARRHRRWRHTRPVVVTPDGGQHVDERRAGTFERIACTTQLRFVISQPAAPSRFPCLVRRQLLRYPQQH